MAAAGLGNLVSDVSGVWAGSSIEKASRAMGFKLPQLSEWQMQHKSTKRYENFGSALGVSIGCLLGMFPLLLMDANKDQEKKEGKPNCSFKTFFMNSVKLSKLMVPHCFYVTKKRKSFIRLHF